MAGNLPLGFAQFTVGAVFVAAGLTGGSVGDVLRGTAKLGKRDPNPWSSNPGSDSFSNFGAKVSTKGMSKSLTGAVTAGVKQFGLKVTSTTRTPESNAATGGAKGSYHLSGRAVDLVGTSEQMAAFYRWARLLKPTELFYDPLGGVKDGKDIGPVGGHSDHVHIAF